MEPFAEQRTDRWTRVRWVLAFQLPVGCALAMLWLFVAAVRGNSAIGSMGAFAGFVALVLGGHVRAAGRRR
jgi:hypothetical protein